MAVWSRTHQTAHYASNKICTAPVGVAEMRPYNAPCGTWPAGARTLTKEAALLALLSADHHRSAPARLQQQRGRLGAD